jgi:hypothetical protein
MFITLQERLRKESATRRYYMAQIPSNGLRLTTVFIAGSMLLSSLTGCGVYKDWKQKEETRLMQTTREAILGELAERKANEEANKNWLQRHWTGVSIGILTTWAVGITAFMIFKWPKGIVGPQGARGIPGIAGKDGRKVYFSIPKEITQIQQNTTAAKQAIDEIKELVQNTTQLAQAAQNTAIAAVKGNGATGQKITEHHLRLEALENAMRTLHQNASSQ